MEEEVVEEMVAEEMVVAVEGNVESCQLEIYKK